MVLEGLWLTLVFPSVAFQDDPLQKRLVSLIGKRPHTELEGGPSREGFHIHTINNTFMGSV